MEGSEGVCSGDEREWRERRGVLGKVKKIPPVRGTPACADKICKCRRATVVSTCLTLA